METNFSFNAIETPLADMDTFSTKVNGRRLALENQHSNPDLNNIKRCPSSLK